MRQKTGPGKKPAEEVIRDIRRATRRNFSAEEKIRIVLGGEESIAELCRREGIATSMYYGWSKEFLEAARNAWPAIHAYAAATWPWLTTPMPTTATRSCARRAGPMADAREAKELRKRELAAFQRWQRAV